MGSEKHWITLWVRSYTRFSGAQQSLYKEKCSLLAPSEGGLYPSLPVPLAHLHDSKEYFFPYNLKIKLNRIIQISCHTFHHYVMLLIFYCHGFAHTSGCWCHSQQARTCEVPKICILVSTAAFVLCFRCVSPLHKCELTFKTETQTNTRIIMRCYIF